MNNTGKYSNKSSDSHLVNAVAGFVSGISIRNNWFTFLSICTLIFLVSCNGASGPAGIEMGKITYDIEYIDNGDHNAIVYLLPEELTFTFRDDYSKQEIIGFMGVFKLSSICDPTAGTLTGVMKLMDKKLYCTEKAVGVEFGYDKMPQLDIQLTDSTCQLAGLKCKVAKITYTDSIEHTKYISYTEEISLANPNIHNPYVKLPGIVMEYGQTFFGIEMKITAKKIEQIELPEGEFSVEEGFKASTQKEIYDILGEMMGQQTGKEKEKEPEAEPES